MSNKYAETSKVKISTLNKNGKTILDDVYFTSPFKEIAVGIEPTKNGFADHHLTTQSSYHYYSHL